MSSTAFIEPLPVIEFVTQLLNRDVSARPLSDADRVKVRIVKGFHLFHSNICSTKMFLFLVSCFYCHMDMFS